jgi:putative acetyltransferase
VLAWARAGGHASVTLITFRDVPWNAFFYERLGFRPLAAEALAPALRSRLAEEARRGLPMERRVVMRAALATSEASSTVLPARTVGAPPAFAASVAGLALRPEAPADEAAADAIHAAAFGRRAEADLVRALRRTEPSYLGLVATAGGRTVGHVAFSAVAIDADEPRADAFGLAPLAVAPDAQRRGVGSALVRAGLAACAARGGALVFVLGHPDYYPRFGFRPAFELGFHYARPAPEPAFFALELAPGAARGRGGRVRYAAAFDRL